MSNRAFGGCGCVCHTSGYDVLHAFPCCTPEPGFEELNPKLQDEIDETVEKLLKEKNE